MPPEWLTVSDEVRTAVAAGRPVVALESTLIAHGLPWPVNLETARESEAAIRAAGAVPATIAVLNGTPTVGLTDIQIVDLAQASNVRKASRRDLAAAVALKQHAATTVSATMALAHAAGIRVFATGGIGGAHRDAEPFDISADLTELARTPVLVVCAGAKSILHLPRTLEILETLGVPVAGYRTPWFPTFYVRHEWPVQPLPVPARVDVPSEAAALFEAHVRMGGRGVVLAQPCPEEVAVPPAKFEDWLREVEREAQILNITGAELTPFLLRQLAEWSGGQTLTANRVLIVANARLAAEVAAAL